LSIFDSARRFRWVAPVGAAALALAIIAGVNPAPASFSDWPKYNFDLANTGMSTDTTINTGNAANLKLEWTNTTGGVGAHSQPTVIGNVVYWNTWDGSVHAAYISGPSAGHNVWMTNLGFDHGACTLGNAALSGAPAYGPVNGTPAIFVVNDAVGSPQGPDTIMYALDAATGATIWSQVLATDPGSVKDFAAWSKTTGNEVLSSTQDGAVYRFVIRRK